MTPVSHQVPPNPPVHDAAGYFENVLHQLTVGIVVQLSVSNAAKSTKRRVSINSVQSAHLKHLLSTGVSLGHLGQLVLRRTDAPANRSADVEEWAHPGAEEAIQALLMRRCRRCEDSWTAFSVAVLFVVLTLRTFPGKFPLGSQKSWREMFKTTRVF